MDIFEANKPLSVYKKLLKVLGDYSDRFPGTGVGKLFNQTIEQGKRILPKDKLAVDILWFVLSKHSTAAAVQKLLNMRFSNLPIKLQPIVKNGRSKEVAFWTRDSKISDKVKDLIDFDGKGTKGAWSDVDGDKVKLLDISEEEK